MPGSIAILSSMDQEISAVQARLSDPAVHHTHGHRFVSGTLAGVNVVTAITGYGKVAAAATTACILHGFNVEAVVFGGVAGGIRPDIGIGDVVVADRLIQHDYDASPLFERYLIPSLGVAEIPADEELTEHLMRAATRYLDTRCRDEITEVPNGLFDVDHITLHKGLVASGDQFISELAQARTLEGQLPEVLAVEMEGAAVAQVCAQASTRFGVFRLISDRSDRDAEVDFISFISSVAAPLTAGIIEEFAADLS